MRDDANWCGAKPREGQIRRRPRQHVDPLRSHEAWKPGPNEDIVECQRKECRECCAIRRESRSKVVLTLTWQVCASLGPNRKLERKPSPPPLTLTSESHLAPEFIFLSPVRSFSMVDCPGVTCGVVDAHLRNEVCRLPVLPLESLFGVDSLDSQSTSIGQPSSPTYKWTTTPACPAEGNDDALETPRYTAP